MATVVESVWNFWPLIGTCSVLTLRVGEASVENKGKGYLKVQQTSWVLFDKKGKKKEEKREKKEQKYMSFSCFFFSIMICESKSLQKS